MLNIDVISKYAYSSTTIPEMGVDLQAHGISK